MAPRTAPKQLGGGPSGIVPFSPGKNGSVSISSGFTTGGGTPCVRHDIQVHMMTPTISDHVLLEVLPALLLLLVLPRVTYHYCRARISSSAKHHRMRPGVVHVPCECTHAYAHARRMCVYRQIHTYILYKPIQLASNLMSFKRFIQSLRAFLLFFVSRITARASILRGCSFRVSSSSLLAQKQP